MRIATKITFGFLGVLILTGVVGAIGWYSLDGYAEGVAKAGRMAALESELNQARLQIARFQRNGDRENLVAAQKRTDGLIDMAEQDSSVPADATRLLLSYKKSLNDYGELHQENTERWTQMIALTKTIEAAIDNVYEANSRHYEQALEAMEQSEEGLAHVEQLSRSARTLIEAVLRARQAEAEFQLTSSEDAETVANDSMKKIYLAALAMSKATKGTKDEASVKKVSKAVVDYRKAFKDFIEGIESQSDIADAKSRLDKVSRQITTFTTAIVKRQQQAFEDLKAATKTARTRVADAVVSRAASSRSTTLLSELRLAQQDFMRTGDAASVERVEEVIDTLETTLGSAAQNSDEDAGAIDLILEQLAVYRSNYAVAVQSSLAQDDSLQAMRGVETEVVAITKDQAVAAADDMAALHQVGRQAMLIVTLLAVAAGMIVSFLTGRSIAGPLGALTSCIARLAKGEAQIDIPGADRGDEIGRMARSMGVIRETGMSALRSQKTLDNTAGCLMMVDDRGVVILANPALRRMAGEISKDVAGEMPGFAGESIEGRPFNDFHQDAELHLDKLRKLTGPFQRRFEVGKRTLEAELNPIHDERGQWIGTVIEWWDRTVTVELETEIDNVVASAAAGDFTQRIDLAGKTGFLRKLAESINQLSVSVDQATVDLETMLETMSKGDLTRRMTTRYQGRFGSLKNNANHMAEQLTLMVANVQDTTAEVKMAVNEISTGTSDLAHRTEQAAASLEETASASEELSATVKQNASNAKKADELAVSTNQVASRAGDVVERAVGAMGEIETSAKRITDIISVIDEIAFQTNLLALNASVEAARAGEAGKGFAVVAQEVRQLAQRSAKAASDITTLIKSSNDQVTSGVTLVNQAGDALAEILGSIGEVTSLVQEISKATQEQAVGVQEINNSINNMDEMTQQNAALVEESAASSRILDNQAGKLVELMAFFKLDKSAKHAAQDLQADRLVALH